MANSAEDSSQLSESQQLGLATFTAVTNQEPAQGIPLLQRSEWNVQVNITPSSLARTSLILLDRYREILRW